MSNTEHIQSPLDEESHKGKNERFFEMEDSEVFEELKKIQGRHNKSISGQGSNQGTKIQNVPKVMLAKNKQLKENYFTPKAIAIGPIHANRKALLEDEELKFKWAAKYLEGLKHEEIVENIRREIGTLRQCFDEKCFKDKPSLDDRCFSIMLLVDGCAILEFIYSFVWDDYLKHLNINPAQAALVHQDLFLLENQIPFRVLRIIMEAGRNQQQIEKAEEVEKTKKSKLPGIAREGDLGKQTIEDMTNMESAMKLFIRMSNMSTAPPPEISSILSVTLKLDGIHLLDLLRKSLLDDQDSPPHDDLPNRALDCLEFFGKLIVFICKLPIYLIRLLGGLTILILFMFSYIFYFLIRVLVKRKSPHFGEFGVFCIGIFAISIGFWPETTTKSPFTRRSFRNVQELKAAGIELKPSKSSCLKKVSFKPGLLSGCLRLRPVLVDNSTAGKLLNLIAYEMCPDYHCKTTGDSESYDYGISSYLSFLDSLIDIEQDVKDLRAANILRHRLSSDADVANLFNEISPNSLPEDAYRDVNSQIQKYYERKIPIWIAQFRQQHLSSPWTLLALLAAAVALILTGIQTYFAIDPK
ncbi:hypothetical protein UlMin_037361 [Ulmus minor]